MKKRIFKLPVEWVVQDTVEIVANNIEEAITIFQATEDDIPLGTEPNYIDGSYSLGDGGGTSTEEIIENLRDIYGDTWLNGEEI